MIGPVLFASGEKLQANLISHPGKAERSLRHKKSDNSCLTATNSSTDHCMQIRQQYKRIHYLSSNLENKLKRGKISYAEYKNLMLLLCEKLTETIRLER